MKNTEKAGEWIKRAKSNLARAKVGQASPEILYEDLCFDAQQAVEKALKSLCIVCGVVFERSHDISYLIGLLEAGNIDVSGAVQQSKLLTNYAIQTRYPGEYEPLDEADYQEAVAIAERVVNWVETRTAEMEEEE